MTESRFRRTARRSGSRPPRWPWASQRTGPPRPWRSRLRPPPLAPAPRPHEGPGEGRAIGDDQTLDLRRCLQPVVIHGERDGLGQLPPEHEGARELDCVACPQRMTDQQGPRLERDQRRELDHPQGGEVQLEGGQRSIALGGGKSTLSAPPRESGSDLDRRQPSRRRRARREPASHAGAVLFPDVALDQRARVEIADQNRSSRPSTTAWVAEAPLDRTARRGPRSPRAGRLTRPAASSLSSRPSRVSALARRPRSSATGIPRSVRPGCVRLPARAAGRSRAAS